MKSDWQTAIELVKQGTAMLHDAAREVGTVDDAIRLQDCAERLSLDLAAVSNVATTAWSDIEAREARYERNR